MVSRQEQNRIGKNKNKTRQKQDKNKIEYKEDKTQAKTRTRQDTGRTRYRQKTRTRQDTGQDKIERNRSHYYYYKTRAKQRKARYKTGQAKKQRTNKLLLLQKANILKNMLTLIKSLRHN